MDELDKDAIIISLITFKERRDAVLHEDVDNLEHNLKRLVKFCETDPLMQQILRPGLDKYDVSSEEWWEKLQGPWHRRGSSMWEFPDDPEQEFLLRYRLLEDIANDKPSFMTLYSLMGVSKVSDAKSTFLSVIARPLFQELTRRTSEAANIPSSEIRAMQAVPPERMPGEKQTRIFLSHKTVDKKRVMLYSNALKELGFDPWLDVPEMPAGTNPDRGIKQGFHESCAVVFFITENFTDESFIADEINYAKIEERKKGKKFSIVTLLFSDNVKVPDLLESYIYKYVTNDLEGLYEIIRALPIELGSVLWKEGVIRD